MTDDRTGIRLHVFMARAGIASRRKCEELIAQGKVRVNGAVVREQGLKVGPDDVVLYQGNRIHPPARQVYLALNKPPKYLCSNADPEGRPLAVDLVRGVHPGRLFTVGRLDYLSSGLVFLTDDGHFARAVSHPSRGIEKEYLVETKRDIPEELLQRYQEGVMVEGERYRLKSYSYKHPRAVTLVLIEGKNREIRKVFGSWMLHPRRVHRLRIGRVTVKGLPPGGFRPLTNQEIHSFLES